ncbi:hypothetical protein ACGFY7_10060 [Streptomyces prunicolor]|uniref:hypothetical protein n=1 Tax=Streptomyces prunicolor TaxID=67348 RepID=UPI00371E8B2B
MTTERTQNATRGTRAGALNRQLAAQQWLLSSLDEHGRTRAQKEWRLHQLAVLPVGELFSAVRLPRDLVLAAAASSWDPEQVDPFLNDILGGPVICDPHGHRYYALVSPAMPVKWRDAAEDWRPLRVDCLGHGVHLGVPSMEATEYAPFRWPSYWSVPMDSTPTLCQPLHVARLIAIGRHQLGEDTA